MSARRNRKTEADRLFESYLDSRGIDYRFEPDWASLFGVTASNPDFLVEPGGVRAICEVKHFERRKVWDQLLASPGQAIPVEPEDDWGPVRFKMNDAARKLRPFQGLDVPLVIVLANPVVSDVTLDWNTVAPAILGNDQQTILVGPDAPLGQEGVATVGGHGTFTENPDDASVENPHPHVSAVVAVHKPSSERHWIERALEGASDFKGRRIEAYDLSGNPTPPGFQGTPLPRRLFDGPDDRWYGFLDGVRFGEIN